MTYKKAQKVEVAFINETDETTEEVLNNQSLTYYELPIEDAYLNWDSELTFNTLDQDFEHNLRGLLTWDITCIALYREAPGYLITLYREELTESGDIVQQAVPSTATWENSENDWWKLNINDERFFLVPDTVSFIGEVEGFNPLFGLVKSSTEPSLNSGDYVRLVRDGNIENFNLEHATEVTDASMHGPSGEKGYGQYLPSTLYTEVATEGYFTDNTPFIKRLNYNRRNQPLFVEFDTERGSSFRGYFNLNSIEIGSDIGEHEQFSTEMQVAQPNWGKWKQQPIRWYHSDDYSMQYPLKNLLDVWFNKRKVMVKVTTTRGKEFTGKAFIETYSLTGDIYEAINIELQFRGTDNLV